MPKRTNENRFSDPTLGPKSNREPRIRIIGGKWRGRLVRYSGDPTTRPMKDNTREAVFNLVGAWIPGKIAIDLFAGTGAIGLEALSRGAARAILIERHVQMAKLIEQNVAALGAESTAEVVISDTFFWARQFLRLAPPQSRPWAVFCSPPYALYADQADQMRQLIHSLWTSAPANSVFVVEADSRFDERQLPQAQDWRVREYPPAVVYVWRPNDSPIPS